MDRLKQRPGNADHVARTDRIDDDLRRFGDKSPGRRGFVEAHDSDFEIRAEKVNGLARGLRSGGAIGNRASGLEHRVRHVYASHAFKTPSDAVSLGRQPPGSPADGLSRGAVSTRFPSANARTCEGQG